MFYPRLINSLLVSLEVVRMALFMSGRCHRGALWYLCPTFWTAPWARIKALMSRSVWVCCSGSTDISKCCHNEIYSSVPFIWFWQVVPLVSAHVYQLVLFLSTAGECKVCVCTSRPHHSSEVALILLQWTGSGLWRDWGIAQHLVLTGQHTSFTVASTSQLTVPVNFTILCVTRI